MLSIQKKDLSNNYNYSDLKKARNKELNKWMWLVLLGCFLFQMLPYCVALNLTNVFVGSDWVVWTGGNQTIIGLTFTAGALAAAVAGPFIAKMFGKKINMRLVYSIGVVLAMIGFAGSALNSVIIYSNGHHIPNKYAVAAILWISNIISQIGVMIFSGLGVNNLISKWWPAEKRGFALGIAFAGGSLGNIWMQQVVGALSKVFSNILPDPRNFGTYNLAGTQFATYVIMAGIGLVAGILIAIFICKKPLPSVELLDDQNFNKAANGAKITNENSNKVLEASPLNTKKYPPYWILAVGFLILQMGTVHASSNGTFVQQGILVNNPSLDYSTIMATGGTIFGVCCLIGNTMGGILNDKLGPWKSIFLAGTVQCIAIVCLMLSPGTPALIYLYFALAGLSVYVYTSTPAFISGRLYGAGQSNNHMSILGIFIAVGFAIVNSISGSLTGELNPSNVNMMFGYKTNGNLQNLGLFALICMAVGTVIVTICCFIIQAKGIKGLLEYSPTKYAIVMFKHGFGINFKANKILLTKKDTRNLQKNIDKINNKKAKDEYYNCFESFLEAIKNNFKKNKLTDHQIITLANIYYFNLINLNKLNSFTNINDIDKVIEQLTNKDLIKKIELNKVFALYSLTDNAKDILKDQTNEIYQKYSKLKNENDHLNKVLENLDVKLTKKLEKLNNKLSKVNAITIDESKKQKLVTSMDKKITNLNNKKQKVLSSFNNISNEWTKYKKEYNVVEQIIDCENKKEKYEIIKQNKIFGVQKSIATANFVNSFTKNQSVEGHDLLLNYYNDKYKVINDEITKKVNNKLQSKINVYNNKLLTVNNKKSTIEKTLLK